MELIQVVLSPELKGLEHEGDILETGDGVGLLTVTFVPSWWARIWTTLP